MDGFSHKLRELLGRVAGGLRALAGRPELAVAGGEAGAGAAGEAEAAERLSFGSVREALVRKYRNMNMEVRLDVVLAKPVLWVRTSPQATL